MNEQREIADLLKEYGYKLTNQRKAIIDVLLEHQHQFLSAEQIFEKVQIKYPKTNFSTIYRNLEILEDANIIYKTIIDGIGKYELICTHHHHHHIICKNCGKAEMIDFCPLQRVLEKVQDKNFILTDHTFELYGYCKDCEKQKEAKK